MDILLFNLQWMTFNVFLAFVPVFAGIAMLRFKGFRRAAFFLIWLAFLPNTVYLLTDPINFLRDIQTLTGIYVLIDIFMYLALLPIGVITYIISMSYFEKMFVKKGKPDPLLSILLPIINLLVGFGIVLGRSLRINSWEAFTNIEKVIFNSFVILSSEDLILFVLAMAIMCQLVYMKFRKPVLKIAPK